LDLKFFKKEKKKEKQDTKISIPILLKHKFQSRSSFEFYLKKIFGMFRIVYIFVELITFILGLILKAPELQSGVFLLYYILYIFVL
jgi:hypothetical protein